MCPSRIDLNLFVRQCRSAAVLHQVWSTYHGNTEDQRIALIVSARHDPFFTCLPWLFVDLLYLVNLPKEGTKASQLIRSFHLIGKADSQSETHVLSRSDSGFVPDSQKMTREKDK